MPRDEMAVLSRRRNGCAGRSWCVSVCVTWHPRSGACPMQIVTHSDAKRYDRDSRPHNDSVLLGRHGQQPGQVVRRRARWAPAEPAVKPVSCTSCAGEGPAQPGRVPVTPGGPRRPGKLRHEVQSCTWAAPSGVSPPAPPPGSPDAPGAPSPPGGPVATRSPGTARPSWKPHPERPRNNVMAYHWATLANQRMTRTIWMQSNVVATIAVGPAVLDLAPKGQAHGFKLATSRQMVELTKAIDNVIVRHLPASRHPLYLPTDHTAQVVDILVPTPKPLQSAARVPFLDEFLVRSSRAPAAAAAAVVSTKQVIFPAGDGCRQDCLALQFIRLAQGVFASVDLPLFVYPYPLAMPNRTRATRALGGVIECVRRSASRDDLSKSNGLSPRGYFLSKFGRAEGAAVKQEAQRHFVLSMAGAHAFCSYLLQVKDQHSGHILLDDDGHVVHIDFGFIFDISPAKDMKVEPGGSKLTLDMVEVMDKYDSVRWKWFVELRTSGNLVVRAHRDDFLSIADLMSTHALGCFKADTVANLR